ncbi:hypothetical protein [Hamadaea tsunoensis]|uniref:hypothetical protein n=1 Tax=Hamadaea tsunoensis TaxID=53368 RepID=UPI0004203E54|nr:hypothetical protein [Hamadaea tsunoensis]
MQPDDSPEVPPEGRPELPSGPARPARRRRPWLRALIVLEVLVIVAAVTTTVLIVRHRSDGGQPASSPSGGPAAPVKITIALHDAHSTVPGMPNFAIDSEYPVVSGLADAGLQGRVNMLVRQPMDTTAAAMTKEVSGYGSGAGDGFLAAKAVAYQAGRLVSVRYLFESQFPGAGDRNLSVATVTVRIDTAELVQMTAMFAGTPDDAKVAKVAAAVAQQPDVASCVGGDPSAVNDLISGLFHHPDKTAVFPNWTDKGMQFTFEGGALGPFSCGVPAAVVPYAQLDGLLAPSVAALAGTATGS